MFSRILATVFLLVFGVGAIWGGAHVWSNAPERAYAPVTGIVERRDVVLDQSRWDRRMRDVVRAVIQIKVTAPSDSPHLGRPAEVEAFFSEGDDAGHWVLAHPVGTSVSALLPGTSGPGVLAQFWPSLPVLGMLAGGALILLAVGIHIPALRGRWNPALGLLAGCIAFTAAGGAVAKVMWPAMLTQIRAAAWEPVQVERLDSRVLPAGKNSKHQLLIKYVAGGHEGWSLVSERGLSLNAVSTLPSDRHFEARVNPENPWQVVLKWGWTRDLGVALFPVPFLASGLGGLAAFGCWYTRKGRLPEDVADLGRMISESDVGPVAASGFGVLMVGSFVGMFGSVCAELWRQQSSGRWPLTLFLIPFVILALVMVRNFVRQLPRLWRSRP